MVTAKDENSGKKYEKDDDGNVTYSMEAVERIHILREH